MKKRQSFLINPWLIIGVFLVFASSCEKDDDNEPSTNGKTTAVFNPDVTYDTMADQDGNVYKTVTIGTQTWMAENLRTTKYNDGSSIPNVTDSDEWGALKTGAYCNYNNTTDTDTIATYGRLYNWYTVNTGKLCPTGWHVPTDIEWATLTDYLGGEGIAGNKLKETSTTHWNSTNTGATNETGFTALPGGSRKVGSFNFIGYFGSWWSATENEGFINSAWYLAMNTNVSGAYMESNDGQSGFSIRCVQD